MRRIFSFLFSFLFLLLISSEVKAQKKPRHLHLPSQNIIKTNILGLPLRNYHLEYERVLGKRFSLNIAYRQMPVGKLPFGKWFSEKFAQDDPEVYKTLMGMKIGNTAITPELRFYTSRKGYGQGLYLSLFYRNVQHKIHSFIVDYQDIQNVKQQVDFSGQVKGNTIGLQIGAQWLLGKRVVLDWWIAGPHAGQANATINGIITGTLLPSEQEQIRQELLENGLFDSKYATVDVHAKGATVSVRKAPWGGVKAGLCLGIRF